MTIQITSDKKSCRASNMPITIKACRCHHNSPRWARMETMPCDSSSSPDFTSESNIACAFMSIPETHRREPKTTGPPDFAAAISGSWRLAKVSETPPLVSERLARRSVSVPRLKLSVPRLKVLLPSFANCVPCSLPWTACATLIRAKFSSKSPSWLSCACTRVHNITFIEVDRE